LTDTSKYRQPFPTGTPTSLNVVAWPDRIVEARGHKPGSTYVETVWLGVLGPSTTLCWSRLSRIATVRPSTVVDTTDLAVSLGLSAQLGRNAPITRTLSRMVMFGAAVRSGDTLAIRRALPDVPPRMASRLSYSAQLAHRRWASMDMSDIANERSVNREVTPALEVRL
jgi:hypothetical protein